MCVVHSLSHRGVYHRITVVLWLAALGFTATALAVPDAPMPENPPVPKNRYISFVPGNPGRTMALRVTLAHLGVFSGHDGEIRWVGPPGDFADQPAALGTFTAAKLQCTPHYQDWSSIPLLHVTGNLSGGSYQRGEIAPGSIFGVDAIEQGADVNDAANYSSALTVFTARWTDTVGRWDGVAWTPPDGVVSVLDQQAGEDCFFSSPSSPGKRRVATARADPAILQGFSSVTEQPDAFAGLPFPYSAGGIPTCTDPALFACGNGVVEPGEQCDDHNAVSGDGCSSLCLFEPDCGNGRLEVGAEECDDGNATSGDGCSATCALEAVCGNSRLELDEECDDGNVTPGDGCDDVCRAEQRSAILALIPVAADGPHQFNGNQLVLNRTGQRIRLEAYFSNWDPGAFDIRVATNQIQIDPESLRDGSSGALRTPQIPCIANADCTLAFGSTGARCLGFAGQGCQTAYLEGGRLDYLLSPSFVMADTSSPAARIGQIDVSADVPDDGTTRYLGTFAFDVPEDATGTYSIDFQAGFNRTVFLDQDHHPIPLATINPASIRVAESNRYLPFRVHADGGTDPVAVRVKIVSLPLFPSFDGQVRWAGAPGSFADSIPGATFHAAPLRCDPLVRDWSGEPVVHLYGSEIIPGATYEIRTADAACVALGQESCMSPPVTVGTAPVWADLVSPLGGSAQPNFLDIGALVAAFQGSPSGITKRQAQLQPRTPNPANAVGFLDISAAVSAFQGNPYPFGAPDSCP